MDDKRVMPVLVARTFSAQRTQTLEAACCRPNFSFRDVASGMFGVLAQTASCLLPTTGSKPMTAQPHSGPDAQETRLGLDLQVSPEESVLRWLHRRTLEARGPAANDGHSKLCPETQVDARFRYVKSELKGKVSADVSILIELYRSEGATEKLEVQGEIVARFRPADEILGLGQREKVALWRAQCPADLLEIEDDEGNPKIVHRDIGSNVGLTEQEKHRLRECICPSGHVGITDNDDNRKVVSDNETECLPSASAREGLALSDCVPRETC